MKNYPTLFIVVVFVVLQACSTSHFIAQRMQHEILQQKDLQTAHIGISIYDPAIAKYLYNYQGDKYFVPASNTKLVSLYAGIKYLGDSLAGIRYIQTDSDILVLPTGDPTLLHPDFIKQPAIDFLKKIKKNIYLTDVKWQEQALGAGWSWDDYNDNYMSERSLMPVYGNVIRWIQERQKTGNTNAEFAPTPSVYSIPEINWKVKFTIDTARKSFFVKRKKDENIFEITEGDEKYKEQDVPFVTNGLISAIELLKDTVGKEIFISHQSLTIHQLPLIIHSQPVDSLFRPMMYRSDNFFAEQTLLMAANEKLGVMNDEKIIDTLLRTDLKDLPQKPNWVDGSGLSRYNLFTPQDFVWLLNQMKNEFGLERMKIILPTGGKGTLGNYYKQDSGYIFAKTGSLSGVIALSGYLYTKKNRLLIFSILINNHRGNASAIRKDIEFFLHGLREKE